MDGAELNPEEMPEPRAPLPTDLDEDLFHLSPALAVTVGRLLAGPKERRVVRSALRP